MAYENKDEDYKYTYRTSKEIGKDLRVFAIEKGLRVNELIDLALTEFIAKYKDEKHFKNFKTYIFRTDKRNETKQERQERREREERESKEKKGE